MSGRPPVAGSRALPPLRWFGAADVVAAMPPLDERLALAERTLTALARPGASDLPPKIGIHPRPAGSFVHAMPAHLRADSASSDLVGMKWVAGFATNNAVGLAAISAVIIVNDPDTGIPIAILDGGPITAERTAAVTGVALRHFGPGNARAAPDDSPTAQGEPTHVAIVGAGIQGRSHLAVVGAVLPGSSLHLFDRHEDRAQALADRARTTPGIVSVEVHRSAREAVVGADVVITAASFGPAEAGQSMTNAWLRPNATVVPVDYATYCAAEVARDAAMFLVDHREQFLANREAGNFDGYPDPTATIGEAIIAGTARPAGRVVLTHLGVGLADLVFADAIVRAATADGRGTTLPR
jgi:ornithine cyclodeaminase/alanine dehydrogenase